MAEPQRLWTVSVRGGQPFLLHLRGNPAIDHLGGTSVFHLVMTDREARQVRGVGLLHGCSMEVFPHEGQTPDQARERDLLSQFLEGQLWPYEKCVACAWLDPLHEESPCGRVAWPPEAIETLKTSEKHEADREACPISLETLSRLKGTRGLHAEEDSI